MVLQCHEKWLHRHEVNLVGAATLHKEKPMEMDISRTLQRLPAAALLLFCALLLLSASSSKADQSSISVEARLATPATISLGEPIMLYYKLSNLSSDEKLVVLSGSYNTAWYTLGLKDQAGNSVRLIPDTRPLNPPGPHSGDVGIYATSDSRDSWRDGYVVATKSFSVPRPGKYVLTMHVQAHYTLVPPTLENSVLMKNLISETGAILAQDFSFPLTVTPADPIVLQAKANALKEAISNEKSSTLLLPKMDALFSMPEAQAAPIWQQMAMQAKPMDRDLIASKVAGLNSNTAADILFKMMDNPLTNSAFVSTKLSEIYNAGNSALRDHIKSAAAQRGMQLPDKVAVPQVID